MAGQEPTFIVGQHHCGCQGTKHVSFWANPLKTCALKTLMHQALHLTHLETQTKESNMYESRWATNPLRHKELDKWDPLFGGASSTNRDLL